MINALSLPLYVLSNLAYRVLDFTWGHPNPMEIIVYPNSETKLINHGTCCHMNSNSIYSLYLVGHMYRRRVCI
jgi:hypothetical protein